MKKNIKKSLLGVFVFWFAAAPLPAFFAFAQANSCDNFKAATYTITNNGGSSRFLKNTPIDTSLLLSVKNAVASGDNVDIVLVMDRSGSMNLKETTTSSQTKIESAKNALNIVVDTVAQAANLNNRIALVTFSDDTTLDQPLTNNYNTLKVAINNIVAGGRTSIGGGLLGAANEIKNNSKNPVTRRFIVLASDGLQNRAPSIDTGIAAVPLDTTVYTVGIGIDADSAALGKIAATAGAQNGGYFFSNVTNLAEVFQEITKRILGAFTLQNVSLLFTRDDVSSINLVGVLPMNDSYDSVNGVIHWNNLGAMTNGQQKTIAITFKGVKSDKNIPLNTFSLVLNYTIFGVVCSENVPVNILLADIVDPILPPPTCTDTTWVPDSSTVCSTQIFTQTNNCGGARSSTGTKICAQCGDGIDNDGDGFIDYPTDRGCASLLDENEKNYTVRFFDF